MVPFEAFQKRMLLQASDAKADVQIPAIRASMHQTNSVNSALYVRLPVLLSELLSQQ